jgi:hypothetical protein
MGLAAVILGADREGGIVCFTVLIEFLLFFLADGEKNGGSDD